MNKSTTHNLSRAMRLAIARATGPQDLASVEHEVALELVGYEVLQRDVQVRQTACLDYADMTAFGATEEFAKHLVSGLGKFAANIGAKPHKTTKYDLRFATPVMFQGAWHGRQIADQLGMPYGFFVDTAVQHWSDQGKKRVPRVTQLCTHDALGHVMTCWANDRAALAA